MTTRREFGLLRDGAVFVNAARGSLVDEDALYDALASQRLFAAGLDVPPRNELHDRSRALQSPRQSPFRSPQIAASAVTIEDARIGNGVRRRSVPIPPRCFESTAPGRAAEGQRTVAD
ncbi:NAD(P)-dependent oxidoreductase [Cupriavidus basilensis]